MQTEDLTMLATRLVRYISERVGREYPLQFPHLVEATAWWDQYGGLGVSPPDKLQLEVQVLKSISSLVNKAIDNDDETIRSLISDFTPAILREKPDTPYGSAPDISTVEWQRILSDILLRERGFLYPNEKARYTPSQEALSQMIGVSRTWRNVMDKIRTAAAEDVTTLIIGEVGTGKTFTAQTIHKAGPRRDKPCVRIHAELLTMENINETIERAMRDAGVEYENFSNQMIKHFDGTIIIEEIGKLIPDLQTHLLKSLDSVEEERCQQGRHAKVPRLLLTSTIPLEQVLIEGRFRRDLMFRIAVFQIDLPPLRQRREDLPNLVDGLLRMHAHRHGVMLPRFDPDLLRILQRHNWPGNIRELSNSIESALLQAEERIRAEHFRFDRSTSQFADPELSDEKSQIIMAKIEALGIRVSGGNLDPLVKFLRFSVNRRFRTQELAEDLGVAASTARAYLANLVRAGFVQQYGSKKGTTYRVDESKLYA